MVGRSLTLVLLGLVLSLRALAYATPPDPTWIAGLYDDDDYDDVILLVTSTAGAPPAVIARTVDPCWALMWISLASDDGATPSPPLAPHRSRGPPLS